jgi:thiol:disulfide interchange protein DsbC
MQSTKQFTFRFFAFITAAALIGATVIWWTHDDEVHQVDATRLDASTAIKSVVGSGAHQVHVFESTDCTYCRQLQPELDKLRDVTLYVYMLPGHTKLSNAHANAVACHASPYEAWIGFMRNHLVAPDGSNCADSKAVRNLALAKELGLKGTPTLIRSDGKVIVGKKSAEEIQAWLGAAPAR